MAEENQKNDILMHLNICQPLVDIRKHLEGSRPTGMKTRWLKRCNPIDLL